MISFAVPAQFIAKVACGELVRYGGILKDVDTGQIVGHLKEVGNLAETLSNLTPMGVLSQLGQHIQLAKIQETLETLQIISSVGAITSIATLGVCVAGFISVNNKLNQLNTKLDGILKEIKAIRETVERMNIKWDSLTLARLQTASERLIIAQSADTEYRRNCLLEKACNDFGELKNYYLSLVENNDFWINGDIPVDNAVEIYSRIIVCCLGQLHSEFLLGDLSAFKATLRIVNNKVSNISKFDKIKALRARTDSMSTDIFSMTKNRQNIAIQLKNAHLVINETNARVDTMFIEADYVEKSGLNPYIYIKYLREQDPNIVLIPVLTNQL